MGLDLYYFSLLDPGSEYEQCLQNARSVLNDEELARYRGYSDQKKAEFSLARLIVKQSLAERLGCPLSEINFSYSELGKPTLPGTALSFSISHCKSSVAVAIAEEPVGLDVEQIYRSRTGKQPWHKAEFFINREMAEMLDDAATNEDHKARLFTQLWTCLEARVKMSGDSVFTLREGFKLAIQGRYYKTLCEISRPFVFTSWQLQGNEILSLVRESQSPVRVWLWHGERSVLLDVTALASTNQLPV